LDEIKVSKEARLFKQIFFMISAQEVSRLKLKSPVKSAAQSPAYTKSEYKRARREEEEEQRDSRQPNNYYSYFHPTTHTNVSNDDIKEQNTRRIVCSTCNIALKNQEKFYSIDEVKKIVNASLHEREEQIRMEYEMVLQQKLAEQFENFSKFNEDYISRQMKQSEWSYMS
jgi:hypothetical protein